MDADGLSEERENVFALMQEESEQEAARVALEKLEVDNDGG